MNMLNNSITWCCMYFYTRVWVVLLIWWWRVGLVAAFARELLTLKFYNRMVRKEGLFFVYRGIPEGLNSIFPTEYCLFSTYISPAKHRHRKNVWAFTGPRRDFGLILLILNMIIHESFTGPTLFFSSANVRGPLSFVVSENRGLKLMHHSCDSLKSTQIEKQGSETYWSL